MSEKIEIRPPREGEYHDDWLQEVIPQVIKQFMDRFDGRIAALEKFQRNLEAAFSDGADELRSRRNDP